MAYVSIKYIESLQWDDINKMSKEELINVAKSGVKNSNQRLNTLKGYNSPAKRTLIKNQGSNLPKERVIETLDTNELKKLVRNTTNFLQAKTSKLSGERERIRNYVKLSIEKEGKSNRQIESSITRQINKLGGYNSSKIKEVFELVEQVKDLDKSLVWEIGSPTDSGPTSGLVGNVIDIYTTKGFDDPLDVYKELRNRLNEKELDDLPFF